MNGSGSTGDAERQIRERIQGELGRQFLQRNNEGKVFVASNEFLAGYRLFMGETYALRRSIQRIYFEASPT